MSALIEINEYVFAASPMPDHGEIIGCLRVGGEAPEFHGVGWEAKSKEHLKNQAEMIEMFLRRTLPQGVYYRLISSMLDHAAPQFRIGFEGVNTQ